MANPTPYSRGYSFSSFQSNSPQTPLPGPKVDEELDNLGLSVNQAISGLRDIRRPDGALRNGIVTAEAMAPGIVTGLNPATEWTASKQYFVNDTVFYQVAFYRCLESHVSDFDFTVDLAAGRWEKYADLAPIVTDAEIARDEAVAAADTAEAARDTAVSAAGTATTQASTATGAAGTASAAASAAAASYDMFDDRYLGEKTSLPTLDNDGNAIVNGALVSLTGQVDPLNDGMYVRRSGTWQKMFAPTNVLFNYARFSAAGGNLTAGQTTFTITGGYIAGYANVYRNGLKLVNGVDVTITSGTQIVLAVGVGGSDTVEFEGYRVFDSALFADQTAGRAGVSTATIMSPFGVADAIGFNLGLTRSQIATRHIPVNAFYVTGESAHGDVGAGALYVRGSSGGLRAVQDAAGTWWNLSLTGVADVKSGWFGTTAAALQSAIDAATSVGSVFVSPGTYTLTTALLMRPGVRVWAVPGTATITQGNSANLGTLIDFTTNSAHAAQLVGLVIDGNRANNTQTITDRFAVNVGVASSVLICRNEIRNYTGHGVYATSGQNLEVRNNYIHDVNMYGVYVNNPTPGARNAPIIDANRLVLCGWHGIVVILSTDAEITRNTVIGQRNSGVIVNVSGTTVTWVSGPNFANIVPGNFIIYNGGVEALVAAKASNTSLTINYAAGNGTGLPAALGSADVICSWSSNNTRIAGNIVKGSASLAYSVFADQAVTGADDVGCLVENNIAEGIGSAGYSVQSSGTGTVRSCAFRNNQAIECGLNTTASATAFNSGLAISGAINNIVVEGNQWISYGSAMAPMYIASTALAQIFTANNRCKTSADNIVGGAIVSASSGWGSGATVTLSQCSDDHVLLTVVSGSGPSASPSITVQHRNLPMRRKMPSAQMIGTNGTILPIVTYLPDAATETAIVLGGTPGASTTYYILIRL